MRAEKVAEVKAYKASRDMKRLKPLVKELYQATKEGRNTQRAVIEAGKAGMTIGECVGVIRTGYGIHYDPLAEIEMPDFIREITKE
jgi:methylmalonyl-CoA mutase N-terminal domain/subunit